MRALRYAVIILVLSVSAIGSFLAGFGTPSEDSYITLRYARNLADGQGAVFNEGERVEGYTNPLWMLILAGVVRLGLNPVAVAPVLSLGCWLAVLLVLARHLDRKYRLGLWLLAANFHLAAQALDGVETQAFVLCLLLGAIGAHRRKVPATAIAFAAAWFLRTDGVVYAAGTLAAIYFLHFLNAREEKKGKIVTDLLLTILAIGACYAPVLAVRYAYYGALLPNTYTAKTAVPIGWNLRWGVRYLLNFVRLYPLWSLLAVAATVVGVMKKQRETAAATVFVGLILAYLVWVGGDTLSQGVRFLVPVLIPVALIPFAVVKQTTSGDWQRRLVAIVLLGQFLVTGAVLLRDTYRFTRKEIASQGYHLLGEALEKKLTGKTVAVEAVGQTGYYAPSVRIFDLLGLTNEVAEKGVLGDFRRGKGHVKTGYLLALQRGVDCFWFQQLVRLGREYDLKLPYNDRPIRDLVENPSFQEAYGPIVLPITSKIGAVLLCRQRTESGE